MNKIIMNECCVCVKAGRIDHPVSEKCPAIECSDCGSYTHLMCLDRRMNIVRCRNCKSINYLLKNLLPIDSCSVWWKNE